MKAEHVEFVFVDLVSPISDESIGMQSVVSGPTNTTSDSPPLWNSLRFCYVGDVVVPVSVSDPRLADHFLSVFDSHRTRRVWQDPVMLGTSLDPGFLMERASEPVRFLTNVVVGFLVVSGCAEWTASSPLLRGHPVPHAPWRHPDLLKSFAPFLIDVVDIPLAVEFRLPESGVTLTGTIRIKDLINSHVEATIVVPSGLSLEVGQRVLCLFRDAPLAELVLQERRLVTP